MPKFVIGSTPEVKPTRLYLEQDGDKVLLKADDTEGKDWFILSITEDGRIRRNIAVSNGLGFVLDGIKRVKFVGED